MKKMLLAAVICTAAYFSVNAQTKGTNTLGVGFTSMTDKSKSSGGGTDYDTKTNSFTLGYGRFIKNNVRMGTSATYNNSVTNNLQNQQETDGYGGTVSLQKYFPLLNKFYAFAGGQSSYMYSKDRSDSPDDPEYRTDSYFLGGYGGLSYFISKRFAFEADLVTGGLRYTRRKDSNKFRTNTSTSLNLSSSGTITNLGFRVYFLF